MTSSSFAVSQSKSFSITDARHMAAKLAGDLKRIQRFYGSPSDAQISEYEAEAVELLKGGYFGVLQIGFKRNGNFLPSSLRYTAYDLVGASNDDDPGRIVIGSDISGASFGSFLTYNPAWHQLSADEREKIKARLTLQRGDGEEPGVDGYYVDDRTYSAGGRALGRSSVRAY